MADSGDHLSTDTEKIRLERKLQGQPIGKYPTGVTQREVADHLGMGLRTLTKYETLGTEYWRVGLYRRYIKFTGLPDEMCSDCS